jgi:uncharacterized protein YndB with AHSA1/START domain
MSKTTIYTACLAMAVLPLVAAPSHGSVSDVAANGFTLKIETHIAASPDKVYAAIIEPARWWSSDHTFSGDAHNLRLDAKAGGCFCETLRNGGSVMHLTVVYADPGKVLRLRGALGPFQALGVAGALTWTLESAAHGTDLTVTYALGGYNKDGFAELSQASDGMLSAQVGRLQKLLETKSPDSH